MANTAIIDLTQLDFGLNKQAFITYLQGQSRFKGYDFTGDDMAVLLDILSINTFRYAFFLNMAISEGFLDSAQLFDSVKSHAKDLNYTPSSPTSATANVTVNFTATGESQPYIIPKGSTFSSQVKGHNFTFSTADTITVASANQNFTFTVPIYEGIYVSDSYIYNNTVSTIPTFPITNPNADTSSLVVQVVGNNTIGQSYNLVTSLLDLDSNSFVYFLQCSASNGNYEVLFGDGVFGYQPENGSTIILDYRVTSGGVANGAALFGINFDPTNSGELLNSPTVITNQTAMGGANAENIEVTRFRAPRWFQVQERCIVPSDYEIVLQQAFPEIQNINAYGGQTLNPPQYGVVVIAVQIANVVGLPLTKVLEYTSYVQARNPLSVIPSFVPANNMYVGIKSTVNYNVNVTTNTPTLMTSIIQSTISQFNADNLNAFDVTFYFSQLTDAIDNADPSIVSNLTDVYAYQKLFPTQNAQSYFINYGFPFNNSYASPSVLYTNNFITTVTSTTFLYKGVLSQLGDDGLGTVRVLNISNSTLSVVANVGTVNYSNGSIQLTNFACDSYSGSAMRVQVLPASDNITVGQNVILSIEPSVTQISVVQVSQ